MRCSGLKRGLTALSAMAFVLAAACAFARLPGAGIRGRVTDPDGLPLPGVVLTLASSDQAVATRTASTVTDSDGGFSIEAPAGEYRVRAELSGFDRVEQVVKVLSGAFAEVLLQLHLAAFQERVTVKGEAAQAVLGEVRPDAPVTATREVVESGMLPNSQYDDVLTLLPNVVRGPDGLISVAGATAPQGALLVNGFNLTDPLSGEGIVQLPLETVDSVEVFSGGYPAEDGRATGGVTSVHTRSGGDTWHATANSFFPRFRFINGKPAGVAYWEPNAGFSGPIGRRTLLFSQGISYRFDRDHFETLAGAQDSVSNTLMSWSQLDWHASDTQQLSLNVAFDPQRIDHAHVTAFTAVGSTPRLERGGWSVGLQDHLTVGRNSELELRAVTVRGRMHVMPNGAGAGAYEMAHDTITGAYYDARDTVGTRTEGAFAWSWAAPHGHQVKAGASVYREAIDGSESAAPVDMFDDEGILRRRITFMPAATPLTASATHGGFFVQDRWTISPRVSLDAGARFDESSAFGSAMSPRVAWTVKLPLGDSTLAGSAGLFADKVPLQAYAFAEGQGRLVETWDASGVMNGSQLFTNALGPLISIPTATRWDLEFAHRFNESLQLRAKYQERRGSRELVVEPVTQTAQAGTLTLEGDGVSRARSLEVTAAYRAPGGGQEWYASYVRAKAQGPVNSLAEIQGPFREAYVQADQLAPLRSDVPDRALIWGLVHLPHRVTIAPFLEVRDGFPYSPIDATWTYAAPVNSARLPWFASLDCYIHKVFTISHRLPDARLGLKLYNVASVHTQRDVQRDVTRADFGQTYNPIPRDFTVVFELLWGHQ